MLALWPQQSLLLLFEPRDLFEGLAELGIILFHAVIEVDLHPADGQGVENIALVVIDLLDDAAQLLELLYRLGLLFLRR